MKWSNQQAAALKAVARWQQDRHGPQVFRLFGYAGTGKTTLAMEIAAQTKGTVLFAAFTGKAALVLGQKGCKNASTIHSLIYKAVEDEDGTIKFKLNPGSNAADAALIIVDEVSMVDTQLGTDLTSYGTRVLVLGDPEQLPPVRGTGFFVVGKKPDAMLTEIHRQAQDNPIIRLSMMVREGSEITPGAYGDSKIITKAQVNQADVLDADQVLVGTNKSRRAYNNRIRQLLGMESITPLVNDKLVCLRNNHIRGLLNGGIFTCTEKGLVLEDIVLIEVSSLDRSNDNVCVTVPIEFFLGTEDTLDRMKRWLYDEFDYGYALTAHKAQGSQWDDVFLFDESRFFREHRKRWLYTAITRAAEKITIVL